MRSSDLLNGNWLRRLALPLRSSHPRAYTALNDLRRRVLVGRDELDAYQANAVRRVEGFAPLRDARVLELGSDVRMRVLEALRRRGVREVVGVNNAPGLWPAEGERLRVGGPGVTLRDGDAAALPFEDASFDVVFCVAVLEHLPDLPAALREVRRVLRPGGTFYAAFGPVWSSAQGHHVTATERFYAPVDNPLPDFVHLLLHPEELRAGLAGKVAPELVEPIVEAVYAITYINRLFFHEYLEAFEAAPMRLASLRPERDPVAPELLRLLTMRYPRETRFDVANAEVVFVR